MNGTGAITEDLTETTGDTSFEADTFSFSVISCLLSALNKETLSKTIWVKFTLRITAFGDLPTASQTPLSWRDLPSI